jgi:hypothetical protein
MKGKKDHGRYSNLDHSRYVATVREKRVGPCWGFDVSREDRAAGRRKGLAERRGL